MLKLGNASLDGTKVQANASRHKALGWGHAKRLEEQLRAEVSALPGQAAQAEIERRAQERHAAEQADHEERLEARREKEKKTGRKPGGRPPQAPQAGPRDADQVNLTDPESRIMPTSDGFEQACNAQSGVDIESHLVVTADVVDRCSDRREVAPALEALDALPAALGQPVGRAGENIMPQPSMSMRCRRRWDSRWGCWPTRGISAGPTWRTARRRA